MKLVSRYNRINIIATIIVLLVASIFYFFILRYVLIHQLDNTLKVEEAEISNYVKVHDQLPEATDYRDQHTHFEEVSQPVSRQFNNIRLRGEHGHEMRSYRELSFPIAIHEQHFKASVTKSEEEMEDLVQMIVAITIGIIVLLILILFMANRLLLRRLWEPFYNTLQSIRQFDFSNKPMVSLQNSNIDEFNELDVAVYAMHAKIIRDYETLKNFSDNASHEMQTPLAILNAKLDLLIQEPNLTESQTRQLQSMYDALSRLTKLNQSLLLLTKIENKQFVQAQSIRFDLLITEKLNQLEDLINVRHLQVHRDLQPVAIEINDYLADILLNNLLGNAIRHNNQNGEIRILLEGKELTISNTGRPFDFNADDIFSRFKKGDHAEGVGLGLAIVKQICDNYGFPVSYFYEKDWHRFSIRLK